MALSKRVLWFEIYICCFSVFTCVVLNCHKINLFLFFKKNFGHQYIFLGFQCYHPCIVISPLISAYLLLF